ncbi:hypothetical protein G7Y89_g15115 [Cudoniella acicularis]|uniref:Apple domain-containing protein n=1 Tax=Cudoniella acicularis TaxID=354080 RepID=A0A8H4QU93_9HELO|nr:hypothetical protein G7Y89_g15115 [Cudoniella acicularis]
MLALRARIRVGSVSAALARLGAGSSSTYLERSEAGGLGACYYKRKRHSARSARSAPRKNETGTWSIILYSAKIYYLEYDTPRAGGFEPLLHLPAHKNVILGVITSKFPELEDKEKMKERIYAAAEVIAKGAGQTKEQALERLGVSPQCGFASHEEGNDSIGEFVPPSGRQLAGQYIVGRQLTIVSKLSYGVISRFLFAELAAPHSRQPGNKSSAETGVPFDPLAGAKKVANQAISPAVASEIEKRWAIPNYCTQTLTALSSMLNPHSTTTALCPTPSASMTCNQIGLGNGNNLISFVEPLDPLLCHQECLAMSNCKSFQVVNDNGQTRCNFYNAPAAGIISPDPSGLSTFWDRDCGDLLPAACSTSAAPSTPATTAAPSAVLRRRGNLSSPIPYPTFLSIAPELFDILCSCVITTASPTTTITQSDTLSLNSYASVTTIITETFYVTENPNWSGCDWVEENDHKT